MRAHGDDKDIWEVELLKQMKERTPTDVVELRQGVAGATRRCQGGPTSSSRAVDQCDTWHYAAGSSLVQCPGCSLDIKHGLLFLNSFFYHLRNYGFMHGSLGPLLFGPLPPTCFFYY